MIRSHWPQSLSVMFEGKTIQWWLFQGLATRVVSKGQQYNSGWYYLKLFFGLTPFAFCWIWVLPQKLTNWAFIRTLHVLYSGSFIKKIIIHHVKLNNSSSTSRFTGKMFVDDLWWQLCLHFWLTALHHLSNFTPLINLISTTQFLWIYIIIPTVHGAVRVTDGAHVWAISNLIW